MRKIVLYEYWTCSITRLVIEQVSAKYCVFCYFSAEVVRQLRLSNNSIIDSSCWIEYLMDTEIGATVAPFIENTAELLVPTITLYEIYKKLLAEKNEEYALDIVSYMQTGTVIELNAALSLEAAKVSRAYKLPMADSIIYATVIHHSAEFFTCDKHFKNIPAVHYFPKILN